MYPARPAHHASTGRDDDATVRRHRAFVVAVATFLVGLQGCGLGGSGPESGSIDRSPPTEEPLDPDPYGAPAPGDPDVVFPAPAGQRSILLDDFDSHRWVIADNPHLPRPAVTYSSDRNTQGRAALHLRTAMVPEPDDLDDNTALLEVTLPEPEDWSAFDVVTIDIYMAENPTGLAEARLYLENSAGKSFGTPMILGWQLFQWENRKMTFPLTGNTHQFPPFPEEILSDVFKVGIAVTRFSDAGFGQPYDELNFHLDDLRLDGTEPWDTFDGTPWTWEGDETGSGITHVERSGGSAGSLRLVGGATGTPTEPLTDSTPVGAVTARVKVGHLATPLTMTVETGDATYEIEGEPVFESTPDGWERLVWTLPDAVVPAALTRIGIRAEPGAVVHFDDLALVPDPLRPFDFDIAPLGDRAALTWRNPLVATVNGVAEVVRVWAQAVDADTKVVVCEEPADADVGTCVHDASYEPGRDYVYTLETTGDDGSRASADAETIRFRPDGAAYEVGFSADNGAMRHIRNVETGAVLATGSFEDELWRLIFLDEQDLPNLSAAQFSQTSETHRFSVRSDPLQLVYDYDEDGRRLTMTVDVLPLDDRRFDLRASVTNETGSAIRTVSLPSSLTFDLARMERVLLPIQEGLTLLPPFFEEQRSTILARPPMFADVLAYEGADGHLAMHMVQDSHYQAETLPGHPSDEPVFQPNNLGTGGRGDHGWFRLEMVTYIPDGGSWQSATVRISIDRDFRQVAADYRADNGIDRFPSLAEKLGGRAASDQLAASSILAIEVSKAVEWQKTPRGRTWDTIREDWLDRLPEPGVIHLTHWQEGRDWYANPNENHKLEDDHPEALPIWWDRYGSEAELDQLLDTLADTEFLTMPFTNWTVWNTVDPATRELPDLAESPATVKLRGPDYPFYEYKGYMVEPWAPDVQDRNTRMFQTYTDTYPQDLMFVDMTGERSWRYVMADGDIPSAAAYTQGVVDENVRLSRLKPLFTEGVFDRIGNSITGYAQTLRQKFWNQILDHLGAEFEHWTAYPFAADVLHDKVAFYQHDLNSEVWPGEETALASYYSVYGYNYMVDVTKHLGEDEETIWGLDAVQRSVNARTFGQPLLDVETREPGVVVTTWGSAEDPIEITANFAIDGRGHPQQVDGFGIAPDGFLARTARGGMAAGIFVGEFDGGPISDGVHWITVERTAHQVEVRHPIGPTTPVRVSRDTDWTDDSRIGAVYELGDGSMLEASQSLVTVEASSVHVVMPQMLAGQPVRRAIVVYGDLPPDWTVQPVPHAGAAQAVWQVDADSVVSWPTADLSWTASPGALRLAMSDDATTGRSESEPIRLELGAEHLLTIDIDVIAPGARLAVQVQETFGEYRAIDAATITSAGPHTIDLNAVTGLHATNPYIVVLWLEGPGASVDFRSISLSVAGWYVGGAATQVIDASEIAGEPSSAWVETFDSELDGWIADGLDVRIDDGVLVAAVSDHSVGYGKLETIPLTIDLDAAPILALDIAGLDDLTAYSVQLQEQFGAFAAIDVQRDIVSPTGPEFDLRDVIAQPADGTHRVVFWVSGAGSVRIDAASLRSE